MLTQYQTQCDRWWSITYCSNTVTHYTISTWSTITIVTNNCAVGCYQVFQWRASATLQKLSRRVLHVILNWLNNKYRATAIYLVFISSFFLNGLLHNKNRIVTEWYFPETAITKSIHINLPNKKYTAKLLKVKLLSSYVFCKSV